MDRQLITVLKDIANQLKISNELNQKRLTEIIYSTSLQEQGIKNSVAQHENIMSFYTKKED